MLAGASAKRKEAQVSTLGPGIVDHPPVEDATGRSLLARSWTRRTSDTNGPRDFVPTSNPQRHQPGPEAGRPGNNGRWHEMAAIADPVETIIRLRSSPRIAVPRVSVVEVPISRCCCGPLTPYRLVDASAASSPLYLDRALQGSCSTLDESAPLAGQTQPSRKRHRRLRPERQLDRPRHVVGGSSPPHRPSTGAWPAVVAVFWWSSFLFLGFCLRCKWCFRRSGSQRANPPQRHAGPPRRPSHGAGPRVNEIRGPSPGRHASPAAVRGALGS